MTILVCKRLLPILDKPMIYYPPSALMFAGIREILIIATPEDQSQFVRLLGGEFRYGIDLIYVAQEAQMGLPRHFLFARIFLVIAQLRWY